MKKENQSAVIILTKT